MPHTRFMNIQISELKP